MVLQAQGVQVAWTPMELQIVAIRVAMEAPEQPSPIPAWVKAVAGVVAEVKPTTMEVAAAQGEIPAGVLPVPEVHGEIRA